ncbi:MAG: HAMP domain-containing histidine kinase [Adlercreutzia caecimuris]|jgi:signal transduction histidine kinase|uniref:sensor histidine kinase n=1 Tax=Adlercreutzia caecimuris TaxID=671266 RepID=UPI00243007E2|nr:HAMP domain-containing sensor histidine kinase [Adlercreutzia caecimuris]MCI9207278.1 HAMP domain-containing histidine kinase [Adlercreutzia caecimuris]
MRHSVKKDGDTNRMALRGLTVVAIICSILFPLLFFTVQMWHIAEGAHEKLRYQMEIMEQYPGQSLPDALSLSPDESGQKHLSNSEQALIDYYKDHYNDLTQDTIYQLFNGQVNVFFYLTADLGFESTTGEVLVFVDMSFETITMITTTLTLMMVGLLTTGGIIWLRRRSLAALDAKDAALKNFFANASHELKTPLTSILAYAEGARQGAFEPRESCGIIVRETEHMSATVNSILELSRLDAGVLEAHPLPSDLREIAYEAASALEPTAALQSVRLEVDAPEPLRCTIDEDLIAVAVNNVLTNALRYAETTVRAVGEKNAATVALVVRNDGAPISADHAATMFDRFATGPGGQTGIGLAVAAEYVRMHTGTIVARPTDSGTEVRIEIPR